MKLLWAALILIASSSCVAENSTVKEKSPEVWVEIHDVSPGWKYWRLEQILNVTEKYPKAYSKVVLFVIPNHANTTPLRRYPDYTSRLKTLAERGYIIGIHGYAHPTNSTQSEFNVTRKEAAILVEKAKEEFESAGLEFPSYFAPPQWTASPEASSYLAENFEYVYYAGYVATPRGKLPYTSHEYTAYNKNVTSTLIQAKKEYIETKEDVFRLTIHLYSANVDEGLKFLDEFLSWIRSTRLSGA